MPRSQRRDKTPEHSHDHQPDNYSDLHNQFRWQVPDRFNMAEVCSARWAKSPDASKKIAVIAHQPGAEPIFHTYSELHEAANRASNVLRRLGVQRGDRVAIVLPQRFETAVAYMAVLQLGAIAMPLSQLFGPEALEYRLRDSDAVVAIVDGSTQTNVDAVRAACPALRHMLVVDGTGEEAWNTALVQASKAFTAIKTKAEEGAVLIYTSGTTGPPKGALIPHRALIGNLSGFV